MITIHLIPQAHLDPIWLWPWTAGVDEAIATCRTACDLMDRHADMTFNMGDAWVIEQVEQIDPATFARIKKLVAAKRWDLSGGWYIQPDCNFPIGDALKRQIEIGIGYVREKFGVAPSIAMNVDSFGHAQAFPTLLRAAGQDKYVMMRPQEHEMKLPARLFRWQDPATGDTVTTFRIAGAYCTPGRMSVEHLRDSLTELPSGAEHTMCFFGVSDHGGGPTEEMLDFCRKNKNAIPGATLEFSTPTRFFEAIAATQESLPLVKGELQFHAIGCYSVEGRLKRAVRKAEHFLLQAERCRKLDPATPADGAAKLRDAWKSVCFHEFHDTIGGTCLPSAYAYVMNDIGGATAEAERQTVYTLRRLMLAKLGDNPLQRIVLFNPSDKPFDGYVEFEPWVEFTPWQSHWRLLDGDGKEVPYQKMDGEAMADSAIDRLVFRVSLQPDEIRAIRIDCDRKLAPTVTKKASVHHDRLTTDSGVSIHHDSRSVRKVSFSPSRLLPAPELSLLDDSSDTWTHRLDRYPAGPGELAQWSAFSVIDTGPLMCSLRQEGCIGRSDVVVEWRVYAGMPFVDLSLRINWTERQKVLKLLWSFPSPAKSRTDGTLGGSTARPTDGREYPLQDWIHLKHDDGADSAIICPDSFGIDVTPDRARVTLLRSPLLAHHDPNLGLSPRKQYADRGEHVLRFRFLNGASIDPGTLGAIAHGIHQPPLTADLTRGMPARRQRNQI